MRSCSTADGLRVSPQVEVGRLDWRNIKNPLLIPLAAFALAFGIGAFGWLIAPIALAVGVIVRGAFSLISLRQSRPQSDGSYELYATLDRATGRLRLTTEGMAWRPRDEEAVGGLRFSWSEARHVTLRPAVSAPPVCVMFTDAAGSPSGGFVLSLSARGARRVFHDLLVNGPTKRNA
jgi:hypothetical protein